METLKIYSNVEDNKIVLNFDGDSSIEINTTTDIELTGLVERLTVILATGRNIEAQLEESEDPKLSIAFETIKGIIDSYNASVDEYLEAKKNIEVL